MGEGVLWAENATRVAETRLSELSGDDPAGSLG